MNNYQRLRYTCLKSNSISERVVDRFLLNHCDLDTGLANKFIDRLEKHRHINDKMPDGWINGVTSQYIAFELFRQDGLANRYIDHPRLQKSRNEQEYVQIQIDNPWRYSFCTVVEHLRDSFFKMEDVLTGEQFLLYSPGIEQYEAELHSLMYFALISSNDACKQTYGPILFFEGMLPFDLLYYAKRIEPTIASNSEIVSLIEQDPIPFLLLTSGAQYPLVYHGEDMMLFIKSEFEYTIPEIRKLEASFKITYKSGVYQLLLKRWYKHPHFCEAYYVEAEQKLMVKATTDRGYAKIIEAFNQLGIDLPTKPQERATASMRILADDIFGQKTTSSSYEELFHEETPPEDQETLELMNRFTQLLLPHLSSGSNYDIHELAEQAGIEYEIALQIEYQILKIQNKHLKK